MSCFAPYIYGRTLDLHLLKPDEAALRAGVPFLGYARNERKLLVDAGAELVVGSLEQVLQIVRSQPR